MIKEHQSVVLTTDLANEGLTAGDIGTVVHIHKGGRAYEVEFMTLLGKTVTVTTLDHAQVRPVFDGEVAHARLLSARSA